MPPEVEAPLALAYRFLARRERTVAETRAHLVSHGLDQTQVEETIVTVTEQGYLDDGRFALLFVQDKRQLQGWGEQRIRCALEARGIDRESAEAAVGQEDGQNAELDRALAILRQRIAHPRPGRRDRERALGLLLRRGYDYDVASDAVRAHLGSGSTACEESLG